MRSFIVYFILASFFVTGHASAVTIWTKTNALPASRTSVPGHMPAHYLVYTANEPVLNEQLSSVQAAPSGSLLLDLPMADGTLRAFKVWQANVLPPDLAARYPRLMAFTGVAVDDPAVVAKLDVTAYGFHAMIFDGKQTTLIDPYDNERSSFYTVHYKKDEVRSDAARIPCRFGEGLNTNIADPEYKQLRKLQGKIVNGYQLRTYRLALSCNHQYAQAATGLSSPTIEQVLSKMLTSLNRINGVYEREVSVTMQFVSNEDALIWPTATGSINGSDPFGGINNDANACLNKNQQVCDARIGTGFYDIGHLFTTGAGGLSELSCVCNAANKAMSVTGFSTVVGDAFDIDYVVHEIGHEFGAEHTFNNGSDGSCCCGNINATTAYEPGSGSTIMAYAGICTPDDIQRHSDDYFHALSLVQIQQFITTAGNTCAVKTNTGNKIVGVPAFAASYAIPYRTPFELTAPEVVDSVADAVVSYCWEQWNLGDAGYRLANTFFNGPIFRSYPPVPVATRVFPKNELVLSGVLSDVGTDDAQGEKAPDTARYLTFKLTVRNIYQGKGCFQFPDDTIHLDVINTGSGFKVTSQSDSAATYVGGSLQQVTWDVAQSNAAPINAANVEIYMSADGGNTWQYNIGTFPNTGSAMISLPNPDTTLLKARIKVKGAGNVFFNVNKYDFAVTHGDDNNTAINIYPVPVHSTLRVSTGNKGLLKISVFNAVGQEIFTGSANGILDIPVDHWARGIYIMRMIDVKNDRTVRKFVVY